MKGLEYTGTFCHIWSGIVKENRIVSGVSRNVSESVS
jgi:hypothetical protein